MRKIFIAKETLKNLFCKRSVDNGIINKRIFGISLEYVHGRIYENYISVLKYIKPYLNENIENLIINFEQKSKKKHISSTVYQTDLDKYLNVIDNFEPSILKATTGKLRKIQLKELQFAKEILEDIEINTNIKPFMDDGTLLGAVRHKGFIPWDDDIDFSLMRNDFEKLEEYFKSKYLQIDISNWILKKEDFTKNLAKTLEKYPNQIFFLRRNTSMKIFKGVIGDYCFCDFFPLDYYDDFMNIEMLQKYAEKIKCFISDKTKTFAEVMTFQQNERMKNSFIKKDSASDTIQVGLDNFDFIYYSMKGMRRTSDVFPLIKLEFEDTEFYAPNNPHEYLKTIFNNYNKIPHNIKIAQHQESWNILNR